MAGVNSNNKGLPLVLGLIGSLALLLAAAAGLGVLAAVMLQTRERAYHMGVFRAVGMTPRQTIAMVVCSVAGTGLVAGVAAIPAGIALLRYLVPIMGADAGTGMPPSYLNVYGGAELAGLALAGVVIAVAGALLPATWAARGTTSFGPARRVRHGGLVPRSSVTAGDGRYAARLLARQVRRAVAQHELLDLAGSGLRQLRNERDPVRALKCASRSLVNAISSASVALAPSRRTTNAYGASPHLSCGKPTIAASSTAGCRSSVPSTSTEEMFSPPLMITSLIRSRIST